MVLMVARKDKNQIGKTQTILERKKEGKKDSNWISNDTHSSEIKKTIYVRVYRRVNVYVCTYLDVVSV